MLQLPRKENVTRRCCPPKPLPWGGISSDNIGMETHVTRWSSAGITWNNWNYVEQLEFNSWNSILWKWKYMKNKSRIFSSSTRKKYFCCLFFYSLLFLTYTLPLGYAFWAHFWILSGDGAPEACQVSHSHFLHFSFSFKRLKAFHSLWN